MFKSAESRFALRSFLVGLAGFFSSLSASMVGSDLTSGETVLAISTGLAAGLAYAGIGALTKQVEPNVGNKMDVQ